MTDAVVDGFTAATPWEAKGLALEMLKSQGGIPDSPGITRADGRVTYCAAAALSAAGAALTGCEEARDLLARAISSGEKRHLLASFRVLGWDEALCDAIVRLNDRSLPSRRIGVIDQILDR